MINKVTLELKKQLEGISLLGKGKVFLDKTQVVNCYTDYLERHPNEVICLLGKTGELKEERVGYRHFYICKVTLYLFVLTRVEEYEDTKLREILLEKVGLRMHQVMRWIRYNTNVFYIPPTGQLVYENKEGTLDCHEIGTEAIFELGIPYEC